MLRVDRTRLGLPLLAIALAATVLPVSPAHGQAQTSAPKPEATWGTGPNLFSLATGSPGELGLLEVLATEFAKANDATVIWFKAGSGQAMRLLQDRKVDMVLAHAPPAERKAVADGWATGRRRACIPTSALRRCPGSRPNSICPTSRSIC